MKKIIILLISASILLSVAPAYAKFTTPTDSLSANDIPINTQTGKQVMPAQEVQNQDVQAPVEQTPAVQVPEAQAQEVQIPLIQVPVVHVPVIQPQEVQTPASQAPVVQNPAIQSPEKPQTGINDIPSKVNSEITVNFNGEKMNFDAMPMIKNDRIMVPFRAIFEALGCTVTYYKSNAAQVVTAKKGDDSLMLVIGDSKMSFAGKQINLDAPAMIAKDRTLVPLRAVSEAFDASVNWDPVTKTAEISPKCGDHKITAKSITDQIAADNGTNILNISVSYPQIDNPKNSAYIDKLNTFYASSAESFVKTAKNMKEKVLLIYEQQLKMVAPMEVSMTYTVDTDEDGVLSITQHAYKYLISDVGFNKASNTFDMVNETELTLNDIPSADLKTKAISAFEAYYLENYKEAFTDTAKAKLGKEIEQASFYLSQGKLVLYFNPYRILDEVILPQMVELDYDAEALKTKLTKKK